MKKLLSIIGAFSLTTISTATVIACGEKKNDGEGQNLKLEEVVTETYIGDFLNHEPTNAEILEEVKKLNIDLKTEEVHVSHNEKLTAIITVNKDSKVYQQASVTLTYKVSQMKNLSEVFASNNKFLKYLGGFATTPGVDDIRKIIKIGFPLVDISQIEIGKASDGAIKIKPVANSNKYFKGSDIDLPYYLSRKIDLRTIFTGLYLGAFDNFPTSDELLERVQNITSSLHVDEVQVDVNGGKATNIGFGDEYRADFSVKDDSTHYNRSWVTTHYTVINDKPSGAETVEFDAEKVEKSLTSLNEIKWHVSADEILAAFEAANPDLDISQFQVTGNGAGPAATISVIPTSTVYKPGTSFDISYSPQENITNRVWVRNLGEFEKAPTVEEFLQRLVSVQPDSSNNRWGAVIDPNELEIIGELDVNEEGKAYLELETPTKMYFSIEVKVKEGSTKYPFDANQTVRVAYSFKK